MIAKKSPLILKNFFLLKHHYKFIDPSDTTTTVEIVDQYSIDIDFAILKANDDLFQLFTKIDVNNIESPLPGYKLFCEGVCVFSFEKGVELTEEDKNSLLHISGISICINSLRNIMATITSNGPFGKYSLPTIDVNQLLSDKKEVIEKANQSK